MNRLSDRTIIVTGGSSGIGRGMSRAFAREGAHVVIGDVRRDPVQGGEPTDELINASGGRATYVEADISQWRDVDRLVAAALEPTGRLDVLVNNAIYEGDHTKGLLETTEEDWDAMMAVGLRGVFLCCKRAVQQMMEQDHIGEVRGKVINIASQQGLVGARGVVTYCALKGGVVNLTRQLAVDFARHGIIVNAIGPGRILTYQSVEDEPDDPEVLEFARLRTPFPRLGRPEDVAGMAVYVASDECTFVNGAILMVDGGWMAS